MKDPATIALEALGHVRVANSRCTARYKDAPPIGDGPRNPPVWCDLMAGHEGPHRHCTGHSYNIMSREHLIEMKPLPDVCQKCGTKWPCKDAEAVINAFAGATRSAEDTCESCGDPMGDDAPAYDDADICRKCHAELLNAQAGNALTKAKEVIKAWHGDAGWDIYDRCSPEMKMINGALKALGA